MKTAIVIGATSGIGREIAERLAGEGWMVGVTGRRAEELEALRRQYGDEAVVPQVMDVTLPQATEQLQTLMEQLGDVDLFLYVSGVGYQNRKLDMEKEIRTVQTNCEGMVRLVGHFFNHVRESRAYSPKRKAHIAVVTSVAGTAGLGTAPAYSATKKMQSTYVTALTQLAAMERIPVIFTDIRPGFVATDILDSTKSYPLIMSRKKAANCIMKGLSRKRRIVTFDWKFRVIVFLWRLIPRCIWERATFFTMS